MGYRRRPACILSFALMLTFFFAWPNPLSVRAGAQQPGDRVTLAFVGDILLDSTVGDLIRAEGPHAPWAGVKDILTSADFTMGNLECAVGTTGTPMPDKTWTFRADPLTLEGLVDAGFDVVSLANNHTLDYGKECLVETVETVRAAGVMTVGAGRDLAQAREPAILEKHGIKIGVLATNIIYPDISWAATDEGPGQAIDSSGWYPAIIRDITDLRERVDIVVVLVHWSEERIEAPAKWVFPIAGAMREAGAQIIVGAHPHILNGIDYDGRSLTAFSMGNFVFTTRLDNPRLQIGAVLEVTVRKTGIEDVRMTPTSIMWGRTVPEEDPGRTDTLRRLSSLSQAWDTDVSDDGLVYPILFPDVRDHWGRKTITSMALGGAVEGYPDGTFKPDQEISKGEFAALFARSVATPEEVADAPDDDGFALCLPDRWEYPYLRFLATNCLIPQDDPYWVPDEACSRLDALEVMEGHWNLGSGDTDALVLDEDLPESLFGFTDLGELGPSSIRVLGRAVEAGIVAGYGDGTIRPMRTITRAEMLTLLCRYLEFIGTSF